MLYFIILQNCFQSGFRVKVRVQEEVLFLLRLNLGSLHNVNVNVYYIFEECLLNVWRILRNLQYLIIFENTKVARSRFLTFLKNISRSKIFEKLEKIFQNFRTTLIILKIGLQFKFFSVNLRNPFWRQVRIYVSWKSLNKKIREKIT